MIELIKIYRGKIPDKILQDFEKEAAKSNLTKEKAKLVLQRIHEEYDNAKVSPGEAIGIITAESFGEPSTQMSIPYKEKIIIKIGGKIKIIEIGKFVNNFIELKGSLKLDNNSEVIPINDLETYVPSINQDEKIEWKKVIELSRHKSPNKLVKLTTASGREIVATGNHSFVVRLNNSIVPIKGDSLRVGDRIPVLNNFFTASILQEIKVNEHIINDSGYIEEGFIHSANNLAKPIKNTIPLDWSTGWFIGAYLAEGSSNGFSVGISNIDEGYIEKAKDFANVIGLDWSDRKYPGEYGASRTLTMYSSLLGKFIVNSCGKGSASKIVPGFAYSAKEEFVAGLLRAYFDGDGNFHVDRNLIRVSSNSKELIDGIALLLLRFKIFSYKVKDKKNQHWLLIPYKYAPLFLAHIGSDIDYKLEALMKMSNEAKKFWKNYSRDYTDMISGFNDLFYNTAKKLGYPTRYVNNFTKRQKIGRTALYRYIKLFERLAKEKNVNISNELKVMYRMFNSDVIWDAIEKIEYINKDSEYVYDLSVPGLETFTTFDGIITHNTLNVFHFAGVAEVSVTLGLPRLIEIFDARKKLSTPAMEIYLKKEISKDADKVKKIALNIKETKLKEVVSEFSINIAKFQIELALNKKKMRDISLTPANIAKILNENIKTINAKESASGLVVKPKNKEDALTEIYKLKEKIKEVYIKGVEGITHVLPVKRDSEFVILTAGSNLKEVLNLNDIDHARVKTNNVFEVEEVLGIEAARQAIIEESVNVIKEQGLDIDMRHIMFIADLMTAGGNIRGITRTGITSGKESVLARASFETPIKHIVNASLIGEEDLLNSVVENVMLNQPVPLGTGLPDLIIKMMKEK